MPKIIKAGKVLTSNSLNAEIILSENIRKQNELDRIANDATRANVVEAIEIEYAPRLTTIESQLVDTVMAVDEIPASPLPREADRLGGFDASYFAPKASAQMYKLTGDNGMTLTTPIVDFNTLISVGNYFGMNTDLNRPADYTMVMVYKKTSYEDIVQSAYDVLGQRLFYRNSLDGGNTWKPWKEMADTSMAIIESGSNANGRYVKYGDGTMICRGKFEVTLAGASSKANLSVTFPSTFVSTDVALSLNPYGLNGDQASAELDSINCVGRPSGVSAFTAYIRYITGAVDYRVNVSYMAIGRWKA